MNFTEDARRRLAYTLSLPERTIRSLAALVGGTTLLLTETLFPEALKGSTLYKIFIGDTQKFLVEKIARIQPQLQAETSPVPENYIPRKMVGNALETAGLLAIHFSPLWVFAIAGDAAAGSKVFLDRLIDHLKRNGVISTDAYPSDLTALLEAMQAAARTSAVAIDTPPLSRQELEKLADELSLNFGRLFMSAANLLPRLDLLWERIQQVARRESLTVEQVSGILTVDLAEVGVKSLGAADALRTTGSELIGDQILDRYTKTLDGVAKEGTSQYIRRHMQPFLYSAAAHLAPYSRSTTEDWLQSLQDDRS